MVVNTQQGKRVLVYHGEALKCGKMGEKYKNMFKIIQQINRIIIIMISNALMLW